MRKSKYCVWIVLALVVCCATSFLASACSSAIGGKTYRAYTYDTSVNRYVDLNTTLTLSPNLEQFELSYGEFIHLIGKMDRTVSGYNLVCDGNAILQIKAAISALLDEEDPYSEEAATQLEKEFAVEEQIFVYQNCIFSSNSIDLIRRVKESDNNITYTSVEGYYESASNADDVYWFKDGKVYSRMQDEKGNYLKDESGEPVISQSPSASYVLANGLMILTRLDEKGKEILDDNGRVSRIAYLMATIAFPKDVDDFAYTDDDYSKTVKTMAQVLRGKSVGVLTKTFYTTKDLSDLNFD